MPSHASHILFEDPPLCTEFDPKTRKYPLGQEIRALKFRAASAHHCIASHTAFMRSQDVARPFLAVNSSCCTFAGCSRVMLMLQGTIHNQRAIGAGSETANVSAGYCGEGEEKLPHMGTVAHCK